VYLVTVTRTTQNEALPWKFTDLGIEEAHLLVPEHFVPRPYWYMTFLHAGNVFLLQEQDIRRANAGRFRKSIKIKITGKTAGDLPHGEGRSRT
jgi:hypothetical protein